MNVIVLHGSMRKNGNTGLLSDEFLRGAADRGHTVEKIEPSACRFYFGLILFKSKNCRAFTKRHLSTGEIISISPS